jgi:hypothetical protein
MKELKIPFLNMGASKNKVALDIGTSSVKSIVISKQKTGAMQVDRFSIEQIEAERSRKVSRPPLSVLSPGRRRKYRKR